MKTTPATDDRKPECRLSKPDPSDEEMKGKGTEDAEDEEEEEDDDGPLNWTTCCG